MNISVKAGNRIVWARLGTQVGDGAAWEPDMNKGPEGSHSQTAWRLISSLLWFLSQTLGQLSQLTGKPDCHHS